MSQHVTQDHFRRAHGIQCRDSRPVRHRLFSPMSKCYARLLVTNVVAPSCERGMQSITTTLASSKEKWRCPVHSLIKSSGSIHRGRKLKFRWRRNRLRLSAWFREYRAVRRAKIFAHACDFYRRHEGENHCEMQRALRAARVDSRAVRNVDLLP